MFGKWRTLPDHRKDVALLNRAIAAVEGSVVAGQFQVRFDRALTYIGKRLLPRAAKLNWLENLVASLEVEPERWPRYRADRVPPEAEAAVKAIKAAPGERLGRRKLISVIRRPRGTSEKGAGKWLEILVQCEAIARVGFGIYGLPGSASSASKIYIPISQQVIKVVISAGYRTTKPELRAKPRRSYVDLNQALRILCRAGVLMPKRGDVVAMTAAAIRKDKRDEPICDGLGHVIWKRDVAPPIEDVVTTLRPDRPRVDREAKAQRIAWLKTLNGERLKIAFAVTVKEFGCDPADLAERLPKSAQRYLILLCHKFHLWLLRMRRTQCGHR
jgi:hypothetical protein